jgi:hypothetical protein
MLIAQGSIKKQEDEIDRLRKIQKVSFFTILVLSIKYLINKIGLETGENTSAANLGNTYTAVLEKE